MTRLATFAVVLFAVVLSLAPADVDAQTRVERDAFNRLARTVRAAQSNPSPQRLADVRHDIERAYSVFLVQEQRRDEATKWPADMRPSLWDRAAHLRWMHAAADAMVEAANGLESLTPRFIGFDVRHDATLQRLGSAKLAVSRNQDRVLRHASTCRIHGCVMMVEETNLFDQSLQGLVNAAVAAADGLAFHGRRADAESDTARVPLANIEAPPATTPPVLMALPVAPPPPAVETDPVMMFQDWEDAFMRALREAEREARAVRAAEDSHLHCIRGNEAASRVLDLLRDGGYHGFRPVDARRAFVSEHGATWRTINAMLAECPRKPRR